MRIIGILYPWKEVSLLEVIPIPIKINQTNQIDIDKAKGNTQTNQPPLTSFNQIFEMLHGLLKSPESSEQNSTDSLMNRSDTINGEKNELKEIDIEDSGNLIALLALLSARVQQIQKMVAESQNLFTNDSLAKTSQSQLKDLLTLTTTIPGVNASQFQINDLSMMTTKQVANANQIQLTDLSTIITTLQQDIPDIKMDLPLLQLLATELNVTAESDSTQLKLQAQQIIDKWQLDDTQKRSDLSKFANFRDVKVGENNTGIFFVKDAFDGQFSELRQMLQQKNIPVQKLDMVPQPQIYIDLPQIDYAPLTKLTEEQNIMSTERNIVETVPLIKQLEEQTEYDSPGNMVNQQLQQPDKMNVTKVFLPSSGVPISQFVPEVSEWVGGYLKTIQEESGSAVARISLNPEHLGPIQIKIATERGQVTVQIVTDTSFAKEALEVQLPELRQALQQQGIRVQKLDIIQQQPQYFDLTQTNQTFSQGGSGYSHEQRSSAPQNGSKKQKESDQKEMEKEMVFSTYGGAGRMTASSIDFTA